jgi:hypothetical protein
MFCDGTRLTPFSKVLCSHNLRACRRLEVRTAGVNKYDECSQSRSEHVTHPLVELKVNLDLDRKGQDQHTMINHGEIDSSQRKGIGFTVVGSETSRKLINVGKTTMSAQLEHAIARSLLS